ncbi:hypothetical protein [Marinitenerispora sediminis]|uniref:hypothetical protein n=1 Tax=Marinitenerispora sediminis TaxID=1931232 RepID=UPI0011C08262|nr:hypothetical protein [Marinitenerispora sediminis]
MIGGQGRFVVGEVDGRVELAGVPPELSVRPAGRVRDGRDVLDHPGERVGGFGRELDRAVALGRELAATETDALLAPGV